MSICAIDTSNRELSIAIVEQNEVLAARTIYDTMQHSVALMPALQELLVQANKDITEIDRFVVAQGPGSYTGIRIGVTVSKTLAYALNKQLIGLSSLAVLAANCTESNRLIIPIFDARRGNVFTGMFKWQEENLVEVEAERYIALSEWLLFLKSTGQQYYIVGKLSKEMKDAISEQLEGFVQFGTEEENQIDAVNLALLSRNQEAVAVDTFTPKYLKLAEAEEIWLEKNTYAEGGYVERI